MATIDVITFLLGTRFGRRNTICAWKVKYGGMEVGEAEEVKCLRDENARLKILIADLSPDEDILQSVIRKTQCALVISHPKNKEVFDV